MHGVMQVVVVVVMNKRGFDMITLSVRVGLDALGRRFVPVEAAAVLRVHLDRVDVADGRRLLLLLLLLLLLVVGQVNRRRAGMVVVVVEVLRLDDASHPLRRKTARLDHSVTFAHPGHRRRLVERLRMTRRRAAAPVAAAVGRPFEGSSVRHGHSDGGRGRIPQDDRIQQLLLMLAVNVDAIDVVAPGSGGRFATTCRRLVGGIADVGRRVAAATGGALLTGAGRIAGIAAFRSSPAAGGRAIFVVASFQRSRNAPSDLVTLRPHPDRSRSASMSAAAGQPVDTARPAVIVGQFFFVRLVSHPLVVVVVVVVRMRILMLGQSSVDAPRPLAEHEPGIGRHVSFQVDHVIHVARHAPGHGIGHGVDGQRDPRRLSATPQFDHGRQLDRFGPGQLRWFDGQPVVDGRRRRRGGSPPGFPDGVDIDPSGGSRGSHSRPEFPGPTAPAPAGGRFSSSGAEGLLWPAPCSPCFLIGWPCISCGDCC
ncbi:hypothetical protein DAPPUDRAFT_94613 [Daphnia pulex]|uniref:Uncharacterized protein n=1 Tax=Daphnia pulex TaxID=6669 RepID=E9FSJ0_DAPPU|nr:hypothetical protein DAPPUDRAFT_94613 [Daphnia pulex]|eukprot:EFX89215.1 hypothetical protein DAPPUDRAFT_94613 [Daphnia pulex]